MWYHWDCAFYRDTMYYRSSCSTNSGHCASGSDFLPARTPDGSKRPESWWSLHSWRKKFLQRRSWMSLHSWIESVIQKMNDNKLCVDVWSLYWSSFLPSLGCSHERSDIAVFWYLELGTIPIPISTLLLLLLLLLILPLPFLPDLADPPVCNLFCFKPPNNNKNKNTDTPSVREPVRTSVCVLVRPHWTDYKYHNEPRTSSCVVDGGPRVLSLYSWYRLW